MKRILMLVVVVFAIMMLASAVSADPNPLKEQCKDGGWEGLYGLAPDGTLLEFKNQGQCIAYVNLGGEFVSCPCYSAESLQAYYEAVEDKFDVWTTGATDYRNCITSEYVAIYGLGSPYPYLFQTWWSFSGDGYLCKAHTAYPENTSKEANLTLPQRQVCVETILQSAIWEHSDNHRICP